MFMVSLFITVGLVVAFILASLARYGLAMRRLSADARAEYAARRVDKAATIRSVTEDAFVRLYVASHAPRWAPYAAGGATAALAVSPIALWLVPALYDLAWRAGGAPYWGDRTGYVYMFSLFFGLCFIWAAVAAIFARLAHTRRPEPFHHALARARGEPIPDETSWRPRPKWARRARPDGGGESTDSGRRVPEDGSQSGDAANGAASDGGGDGGGD